MARYDPNYKGYFAKLAIYKKLKAIEYKGGNCARCGYDEYYGALEFHHRDPDSKEFEWSAMRRRAWSAVQKELDKCDLLCCRCHREVHRDHELLNVVIDWRRRIQEKKLDEILCGKCGKKFKPRGANQRNCSRRCGNAHTRSTKIDWPSDLDQLVKESSKSAVARKLGVSDKAVAKRLKSMGL